jgi:hypothetical protein
MNVLLVGAILMHEDHEEHEDLEGLERVEGREGLLSPYTISAS